VFFVTVPSFSKEMLQDTPVQRRKGGHPIAGLPSDRLVISPGE